EAESDRRVEPLTQGRGAERRVRAPLQRRDPSPRAPPARERLAGQEDRVCAPDLESEPLRLRAKQRVRRLAQGEVAAKPDVDRSIDRRAEAAYVLAEAAHLRRLDIRRLH